MTPGRRTLLFVLLSPLTLLGLPAYPQAPKVPTDGAAAVEELLNRCLKAGVVRVVRDRKTMKPIRDARLGVPWLEIPDTAKLRAVVAANRALMHQKGRYALIGVAKLSEAGGAATLIHLARIVGEETRDHLTQEVAATLAAQRNLPRPTSAGQAGLKELTRAGVEASALRFDPNRNGRGGRLLVIDRDKFEAVLSARRALLTLDLLDTAVAVSRTGMDHAEVIAAIGKAMKDPRAVAFGTYFLGVRETTVDRLPEASKRLEDAVRRFEQLRDRPWKARALLALGKLVERSGDLDRALDHVEEAGRLFRGVYPEGHLEVALALSRAAAIHTKRRETQRALFVLMQAVPSMQTLPSKDLPSAAAFLRQFALVFLELGDRDALKEARENLERALQVYGEVLGPRSAEAATCLRDLGRAWVRQGELDRAKPLLDRALEISLDVHEATHPELGHCLLELASVRAGQGEFGSAKFCTEQAVAIYRGHYGTRHPLVAAGYRQLGSLYLSRDDPRRALNYYQYALNLLTPPRKGKGAPADLTGNDYFPSSETVRLLNLRGERLQALAERAREPSRRLSLLRDSERSFAVAGEVLERLHVTTPGEWDKMSTAEDLLACIPARLGVLRRLHGLDGSGKHLETAFQVAEQGIARVFRENFGNVVARTLGGVPADLRARERQVLTALRRLDQELLGVSGEAGKEGAEKQNRIWEQRKKRDRELGDLRRKMRQESLRYARIRPEGPCTPAQARACLAADEVALLFAWHQEKAYLVLVEGQPRPEDPDHGIALYPLNARAIADKIGTLVSSAALDRTSLARETGAELFDLLLGQAARRLGKKNLVVVPAGPVCLVPLELLVEGATDDDEGTFLIEKRQVRYAPSFTTLHLLRQTKRKPAKERDVTFWAMGDPVYSPPEKGKPARSSEDRYPRLTMSGDEVRAIAALLDAQQQDILVREKATEANVKSASASGRLARARYVHFAVHGDIGGMGRLPSLVLGQPGSGGEDGFLELDEVTNLQLSADLVVLSACDSGRGRLHDGEGVVGLARSFLSAGSRGVVCSLWRVEDRTTSEVMQTMYAGLKAGRPPSVALREAQLKVLKAGTRAPRYWAPFVYVGE